MDSQSGARLDSLLPGIFKQDEPGASVLIVKGGETILKKGYGLADMSTRLPISPNTVFNIASITKQFTSTAILQLCSGGELTLDDRVKDFFPKFKAACWDEVRIRHLLSHSSGIPDGRGYLSHERKVFGDEALSVEYMDSLQELDFPPGSAYEYMNPTYVLLGRIIEKVSGEEYTEYVRKHLFQPAGMSSAFFFDKERPSAVPGLARAYAKSEKPEGTVWEEFGYGQEQFFATRPDGGICCTTMDFAKWEQALQSGKLLDKELLALARTPQIEVWGSPWSSYQNRPGTFYGFGWFIEPAASCCQRLVYHTGDNGGFKALATVYPESGSLIVIFSNRNDWDRQALRSALEAELFAR